MPNERKTPISDAQLSEMFRNIGQAKEQAARDIIAERKEAGEEKRKSLKEKLRRIGINTVTEEDENTDWDAEEEQLEREIERVKRGKSRKYEPDSKKKQGKDGDEIGDDVSDLLEIADIQEEEDLSDVLVIDDDAPEYFFSPAVIPQIADTPNIEDTLFISNSTYMNVPETKSVAESETIPAVVETPDKSFESDKLEIETEPKAVIAETIAAEIGPVHEEPKEVISEPVTFEPVVTTPKEPQVVLSASVFFASSYNSPKRLGAYSYDIFLNGEPLNEIDAKLEDCEQQEIPTFEGLARVLRNLNYLKCDEIIVHMTEPVMDLFRDNTPIENDSVARMDFMRIRDELSRKSRLIMFPAKDENESKTVIRRAYRLAHADKL